LPPSSVWWMPTAFRKKRKRNEFRNLLPRPKPSKFDIWPWPVDLLFFLNLFFSFKIECFFVQLLTELTTGKISRGTKCNRRCVLRTISVSRYRLDWFQGAKRRGKFRLFWLLISWQGYAHFVNRYVNWLVDNCTTVTFLYKSRLFCTGHLYYRTEADYRSNVM